MKKSQISVGTSQSKFRILAKNLSLALALTLVAGLQSASATLISYSDRISWEAALGAVYNEDFSSVTSDINFGGSSATVGSLTFTSNQSPADDAKINSIGYLDMDAFGSGDYVEVALGGLFSGFGFDYSEHDATGDQLVVSVDGAVVGALANQLGNGNAFFGIIDDAGANIDDFRLQGTGGMYASINTISWGPSTPAPAPTALWLIGLGLLGFITAAKRRAVK